MQAFLKFALYIIRRSSALADYQYLTLTGTLFPDMACDLLQFRIRLTLSAQALIMDALQVFKIIEDVIAPAVYVMSLPAEPERLQPLNRPSLFPGDKIVGLSPAGF